MRALLFFAITFATAKNYTTDIVNDLERRLQQNRDAFIAGPRTTERKTAALRFYDSRWSGCDPPWHAEVQRSPMPENAA